MTLWAGQHLHPQLNSAGQDTALVLHCALQRDSQLRIFDLQSLSGLCADEED